MADPADGLHLSHGIAAAVGIALATVGKLLWGALTASQRTALDAQIRESAAKDVTIATLQADRDHERLERERERREYTDALKALGARLDATRAQLEHERTQALATAVRIRQDSTVDDDLAETLPTIVKNRADIVSPKKTSTPPKGTPSGRYHGQEP